MNTAGLRQVGEFPETSKQIIRSVKNPMDKSTIISIFPKEIHEHKYTIRPGKFDIPAGTYDNPSLLTIGGSSWWSFRSHDQPLLEVPVSSVEVANSIITCYCNGLLGCNMESAMPGLFFVLGETNLKEIKEKHKEKLAEVKAKQDEWFKILVKIADSLWARSNGNPLVISDEARLAARSLNFNDKPWLKDFTMAEMIKCKACGSLKNPEYPVCPACKAIDSAHPMAKDLKFAV